jgi:hypothetical protein
MKRFLAIVVPVLMIGAVLVVAPGVTASANDDVLKAREAR